MNDRKIKQYYRNIGTTKQNQPVTQYYGMNNYNKIMNNYNIDNFEKVEKIAKNKRFNNKISSKFRANSVDSTQNKSKTIIEKNITNNNKVKNHKKPFLNTSVIKDKTPKNFITSFFKEKNKINNIPRNNFYLNTIENKNKGAQKKYSKKEIKEEKKVNEKEEEKKLKEDKKISEKLDYRKKIRPRK